MNIIQALSALKDEQHGIFRMHNQYGIGLRTNKQGKQILTSVNDKGWDSTNGIDHMTIADMLSEDWEIVKIK